MIKPWLVSRRSSPTSWPIVAADDLVPNRTDIKASAVAMCSDYCHIYHWCHRSKLVPLQLPQDDFLFQWRLASFEIRAPDCCQSTAIGTQIGNPATRHNIAARQEKHAQIAIISMTQLKTAVTPSVSNGDSTVLHQVINIYFPNYIHVYAIREILIQFLFQSYEDKL